MTAAKPGPPSEIQCTGPWHEGPTCPGCLENWRSAMRADARVREALEARLAEAEAKAAKWDDLGDECFSRAELEQLRRGNEMAEARAEKAEARVKELEKVLRDHLAGVCGAQCAESEDCLRAALRGKP